MVNNRNRGANGEREVANMIKDELGLDCYRNLDQTRAGGYDLVGVPGYAPEVKRCRQATAALKIQWWAQAVRQAVDANLQPVVIYRQDRAKWKCLIAYPGDLYDLNDFRCVAEVDFELWTALVREQM